MVFLIGIAVITFATFAIGAFVVVAYIAACSQLQLALRTRTPTRNLRGDISMEELL